MIRQGVTATSSASQWRNATTVGTKKNPEIAPRVCCLAPAEIAGVGSKTKPYFASFSINFSTMPAGTSS